MSTQKTLKPGSENLETSFPQHCRRPPCPRLWSQTPAVPSTCTAHLLTLPRRLSRSCPLEVPSMSRDDCPLSDISLLPSPSPHPAWRPGFPRAHLPPPGVLSLRRRLFISHFSPGHEHESQTRPHCFPGSPWWSSNRQPPLSHSWDASFGSAVGFSSTPGCSQ